MQGGLGQQLRTNVQDEMVRGKPLGGIMRGEESLKGV